MHHDTKLTDLEFDQKHIWHPYTSMLNPLPTYKVKSAQKCTLILEDGTELVDGMASWWCAIHGYNHPEINHAITKQLEKMSHVMFGGITHQPAIDLCRKLVELTPAPLEKVFLADSGSVSVEVALKMAIQYWRGKNKPDKNKMLALRHGYHGDTFGAMSVCDPENSMHTIYTDLLPDYVFAPAPVAKFGEAFDYSEVVELESILKQHHHKLAAFILEPIVQGAGGMRIYHPDYLRAARELCEKYQVLLIADEIATGFGRTGRLFACEHAGISPDIMCLGKAITGGYMTLAATLCTKEVAEGLCQGDAGVLMHGPTFMGNPLACSVANASLSLLENGNWQQQVSSIEAILKSTLLPLKKYDVVKDTRVLGAIGVVEMEHNVDVAKIQKQFIECGVWMRPFGKLVYIMPPYIISDEELKKLVNAIETICK